MSTPYTYQIRMDRLMEVLIKTVPWALDPWGVGFNCALVWDPRTLGYDGWARDHAVRPSVLGDPLHHAARVGHLMRYPSPNPIRLAWWTPGEVKTLVDGSHAVFKGPLTDRVIDDSVSQSTPLLVDGWHRLYAAHLRGDPMIKATYVGRRDYLSWLTGHSPMKPGPTDRPTCVECGNLRTSCQCDDGDGWCPGCVLCEPEGWAHMKHEVPKGLLALYPTTASAVENLFPELFSRTS